MNGWGLAIDDPLQCVHYTRVRQRLQPLKDGSVGEYMTANIAY